MIVCRTLGPLEITLGDEPAPAELLWRKNCALLLYLARSPGRRRAREHLVGLLWGDKEDAPARQSLREALRVLRRHTGQDHLETEGGQIVLSPETVQLDVDRFDALANDGDWAGAAELIRGEFLEGFAIPDASGFEDWLTAERLIWRNRGVEALLNAAEPRLNAGAPREAYGLAERALTFAPQSAAAVQIAMRSLALAGDRGGALERYAMFAERLRSATGAEPDATTVSLADRVRLERRWKSQQPALADQAPSRRTPLVGRAGELAALVDQWNQCRAMARPCVALVLGPSGSGKTRLGDELVGRARLDGASIIAARGVEADREQAGAGLLAIAHGGLLNCSGLAAAPALAISAFGAGIPAWAERFPAMVAPASGPSRARALGTLLRTVGEDGPVLIWLDDAHWFDRDSLTEIVAALREAPGARIMLMVTASDPPDRPELDEVRSRLGRDVAGVTLRIGPLRDVDLQALVRWSLPAYAPSEVDRLARRIAADSAGLPLLAVELVHAIAVGMDLEQVAGAWPVPDQTLDQTMPGDLPEAVVAALRVGFRQLTTTAQRVLSVLAVLDNPAPANSLGRGSALDGAALDAALDELEWKRWVTADARGYAFVARIVRDVVASDLVTPGQRERYRAAARSAS